MGSFRAAILLSLARQAAAQSEEQRRLEAKRIQQAERNRQWEEDQLAEMAAMIVRQTKRR